MVKEVMLGCSARAGDKCNINKLVDVGLFKVALIIIAPFAPVALVPHAATGNLVDPALMAAAAPLEKGLATTALTALVAPAPLPYATPVPTPHVAAFAKP
jgi:hypothetical protein